MHIIAHVLGCSINVTRKLIGVPLKAIIIIGQGHLIVVSSQLLCYHSSGDSGRAFGLHRSYGLFLYLVEPSISTTHVVRTTKSGLHRQ